MSQTTIRITQEGREGSEEEQCDHALLVLFEKEDDSRVRRRVVTISNLPESHKILALQGIANELAQSDSVYAQMIGKSVEQCVEKSFEVLKTYDKELQGGEA